MAQASEKMPLAIARRLANSLVERITPYCEQVHIAGSIRREKEMVSDIEVVVVPRWIEEPDLTDLLGERKNRVNLLYRHWASTAENKKLFWIKPGKPGIERGTIQEDGKYWKAHLPTQNCNVDIFIASPDNLGVILLIRTGSAEFSQAVVTHANRVRRSCVGGYLQMPIRGGGSRSIATPTEADVFRELNIRWVEPRDRNGRDDVGGEWSEL